jgi:hypothetical protein
MIDSILYDLKNEGVLTHDIQPQAIRSALIGAVEGMLRDQILAQSNGFPASFSSADVRAMLARFAGGVMKG